MKSKLRYAASALMWAVILLAAYAVSHAQTGAKNHQSPARTAAQDGNTPGRIAKFTTTKAVGDSNITEDDSGKIGIGTTLPTSQLTVNGVIEMLVGGLKFPDGTLQSKAGLATVSGDDTLKGDGTQASPLGIYVPLILNGQSGVHGVIQATNTSANGIGVVGTGGSSGSGVAGIGGNSINDFGGKGVIARGGFSPDAGGIGIDALGGNGGGDGGEGVRATGGGSNITGGEGITAFGGGGSVLGGNGINATGGDGRYLTLFVSSSGGVGVRALGGLGFGPRGRGGIGVVAEGGAGVDGAARGLAGRFMGNVEVTGTLSKAGGSFKIDHPLDPENKYLSHSFVESPDMMNIYNGNITTDDNGLAVVDLPDYFDSLNRDFRYQLTVVGQFAQAIVAQEVKDNRFTIQTSAPGVKVSWQVTGIRHDAWANKNRIQVEEVKSEQERGRYLHPDAFGQAEERGIEARHSELTRRMKKTAGDQ